MPPLRSFLQGPALAAFLVLAAGCDLFDRDEAGTDSAVLDGFTFTTLGGAQVIGTGGEIIVTGIGDSGEDGVAVAVADADQADFYLEPVILSDVGAEFRQRYLDSGGVEVATLVHTGQGDGTEVIEVDFAVEAGVDEVWVVYYFEGEVVFVDTPVVTMAPDGPTVRVEASRPPRETLGSGSSGSGSVHVVRVGGRTVVGTDFGGASTLSRSVAGSPFDIPGDDGGVVEEIDFIEVIPLTNDETIVDLGVEGVALTAANISGFVITEADQPAAPNHVFDQFDRAIQQTYERPGEITGESLRLLVVEPTKYTVYSVRNDAGPECYEEAGPFSTSTLDERLDVDSYSVGGDFFPETRILRPSGNTLNVRGLEGGGLDWTLTTKRIGDYPEC